VFATGILFNVRKTIAILGAICILIGALPAWGTSVVVLRSADGSELVIAADSLFTPVTLASKGAKASKPLLGCKIAQIEKRYWLAIAQVSHEPKTGFNPYQIAIDAASHNKEDLDSIVNEFQKRITLLLPSAMKTLRGVLGATEFERQYEQKIAMQAAFIGSENGVLRLVAIDFIARTRKDSEIEVTPTRHQCPGDCPLNEPLKVFLGSHEYIDGLSVTEHRSLDLDSLAQKLVQDEIDNDSNCHCAPPIDVLHFDKKSTHWVGSPGPLCKPVR
jgi:hypothetical protein